MDEVAATTQPEIMQNCEVKEVKPIVETISEGPEVTLTEVKDNSEKDDTSSSISYCGRKGCNLPRSTDPNGNFFAYCTSSCFWKENDTLDSTKLTLLSENDADYDRVKKKFVLTIPNAEIDRKSTRLN